MNDMTPVASHSHPSLHERATRIRALVEVARHCIIEIGHELIAAKTECAHGEWLPWLRDEFGWSDQTANRYMQVARAFQIPHSEGFRALTIDATALYALAAPDVPQAARDEAIERAETDEQISKADADAMIAKAEHTITLQLRAAFQREQTERDKAAEKSLARAAKQYASDTTKLAAEIERIKAAQRNPDVPQAIEMFCKILGKPKLNAKQMRLLAQVIGSPITDGTRVYQPVPEIDRQAAEANLALAAAAERAIDYFPIAPAPADVSAAMSTAQRQRFVAKIDAAFNWLERFEASAEVVS